MRSKLIYSKHFIKGTFGITLRCSAYGNTSIGVLESRPKCRPSKQQVAFS